MKTQEPKTKVIFRKWPKHQGGDVIALFPEIAATSGEYWNCLSYQHLGQHGAASASIAQCTRSAAPEEYAPLKAELERIGYTLRVVKRFTRADYEKRKAQVCR